MKNYSKPNTNIVKTNLQESVMQFTSLKGSSTTAGYGGVGDVQNLGKGGMTPVSEDNANSIWED